MWRTWAEIQVICYTPEGWTWYLGEREPGENSWGSLWGIPRESPSGSAPWSASEVCIEGFASLLPPFLHSFLPFFLFFFSISFPPEIANFYQANSIKRIKNCFRISEPDQIPDSLLNSFMNLDKRFTPAPPSFFFHQVKNSSTTLNLGSCKHSFKECL